MEKDYLTLKRAPTSRPSGEWKDDDYDVLADGEIVGRIFNSGVSVSKAMDVDIGHRAPRTPQPDTRLRCDTRGRDSSIRKELAARMIFQAARMSFLLQGCSWRPSISQRTCLASYKSISASTQRPCVAARFIWRRNRASRGQGLRAPPLPRTAQRLRLGIAFSSDHA
jgi:hypothetical protein